MIANGRYLAHSFHDRRVTVLAQVPGPALENIGGHWKTLMCPLCAMACGEYHWNNFHKDVEHRRCPYCRGWFKGALGLSMHFAKTLDDCGELALNEPLDAVPWV
jgi:hypothetical protein